MHYIEELQEVIRHPNGVDSMCVAGVPVKFELVQFKPVAQRVEHAARSRANKED